MNNINRHKQQSTSSKELNQKLAILRQQLEQMPNLPATKQLDIASELDDEMLDVVSSDALNGIDISRQYPAFYQKLLRSSRLRKAFLDLLGIEDAQGMLPVSAIPQLTILHFAPGKWRIVWQRTAEQLLVLFSRPSYVTDYRADDFSITDNTIILLHSQTNVEGELTTLTLTATRLLDQPDELQLQLFIESMHFSAFQAHLRWGTYQANISLPANTFTQFPPVTLSAVMDETGQTITSGLDLTLEPLDSLLVNG